MPDTPIVDSLDLSKPHSTIEANHEDTSSITSGTCLWNGATYSDGAEIISGGMRYRCQNGTWYRV